ncbi:hypothetical protein [Pseudomonas aeruginosa]|uniref:hypothetical protein n=1 Tax=Pseudomonas aeruginosa TaxID=287 RepID=UPI00053D8D6D|nr:hypothetical protein [Pseudomonas aeruginosa]
MCELLITGCNDPLMWYARKVGDRVPFVREEPDCYMAREPAGFVNIVRKADAVLEECQGAKEQRNKGAIPHRRFC